MKHGRLLALVGLMLMMLAVRLGTWNSSTAAPVVQAVERHATATTTPTQVPAVLPRAWTTEGDSPDEPLGDPFAVRHATPPPVVAATPAATIAAAPEPSPEPAPPYEVIGTYDDSSSPGVFVATPHGVEIARLDTVLDAEYRVVALTPQSITLEQIATKRRHIVTVPSGETP